jgi:hypothetical protein
MQQLWQMLQKIYYVNLTLNSRWEDQVNPIDGKYEGMGVISTVNTIKTPH